MVGAHQFTVRLTKKTRLAADLVVWWLNSTQTAKGLQVPAVPVAEAGFKRCQEGWNAGRPTGGGVLDMHREVRKVRYSTRKAAPADRRAEEL